MGGQVSAHNLVVGSANLKGREEHCVTQILLPVVTSPYHSTFVESIGHWSIQSLIRLVLYAKDPVGQDEIQDCVTFSP